MTERVGYGRPPQKTQFIRGVSGNPAGRPKGTRSLTAELRYVLSEPADTSTADPATPVVTKGRAIINRLVDDALSGDARAMGLVLSLCARTDPRDSDQSSDADGSDDEEILKKLGSQTKAVLKDQ
jgi:hypothetical protein